MYEEFEVGKVMNYYWGWIIIEVDIIQFFYLMLSYNLFYFNCEYVKFFGYLDIVVNFQFVFNVILGLIVEDCFEGLGGLFFGVFELIYYELVYFGDILIVCLIIIDK